MELRPGLGAGLSLKNKKLMIIVKEFKQNKAGFTQTKLLSLVNFHSID